MGRGWAWIEGRGESKLGTRHPMSRRACRSAPSRRRRCTQGARRALAWPAARQQAPPPRHSRLPRAHAPVFLLFFTTAAADAPLLLSPSSFLDFFFALAPGVAATPTAAPWLRRGVGRGVGRAGGCEAPRVARTVQRHGPASQPTLPHWATNRAGLVRDRSGRRGGREERTAKRTGQGGGGRREARGTDASVSGTRLRAEPERRPHKPLLSWTFSWRPSLTRVWTPSRQLRAQAAAS